MKTLLLVRMLFVLLLASSSVDSSFASGLGQSEVGVRNVFEARCGQNGVRVMKAAVQVVVVGNSGGLRCIIRITQKLLNVSDVQAGYVCVARYEAKFAEFVKEDDRRVLSEKNYAANLQRAKEVAKIQNIPLEVVFITTSRGPPHREPRCKF